MPVTSEGALNERQRWDRIRRTERSPELRIAVLASFTADYLAPYLGVALEDQRITADIFIGPFNQILQECREGSSTAAYQPNVLVVWHRLEEAWGQLPSPLQQEPATYLERSLPIAESAYDAARRLGATLVYVLPALPHARPLGVGDACNAHGVVATATTVREALRVSLAGKPGVMIFDAEEVVRSIGASRAYNPRLAALASMPLSTEALRATGVRLARLIRSDRRPAIKCVVVDGDNTLWGGVVGEDGADHVDLALNGPGVGYREFQRYLGDLRRAGVVVALASKNDERDVWAVFERPEMVLKRADLAAWRVGWQPKSESLRQLAEELSLGLDTFVFIDDNPAELGEVGVALPQVSCIQFPADPVDWLENIERGGLLDRLPPTKEDLSRSAFYAEDRLRKDVRAVAASPEEYLAQLEIAVSVYEPRGGDVQRFAQLVNKTNQFNLNGKRRTEHELVSLLESDAMIASLVSATDKFGDYGAVGAFIVEARRDQCRLDTFVLSCRAMGRGIEEAMVAAIYEKLPQSMRLFAAVLELPRNEPARRFFAKIADGESGALQRLAWPSYVRRT